MRAAVSKASMLLVSVALSLLGQRAWACSSCGSGGADPVILNPAETAKFYLGLSQQSGFQDIDSKGNRQKSYGPILKQSMDLAYAQRLFPRIFASAVLNSGRNVYGSESLMQNGDVTLNSRTTLLQQNMAEPWLPQLQMILSHRFALGRSVYKQKQEHFLDVFGAGYDETYVGADLWYGMSFIVAGGSLLFGFPEAEDTDSGSLKVGLLQRLIGTIGFMPLTEAKLIGGFIHEQRGGSELDGKKQTNSDKLNHDLFLTAETLFQEGSNYRFTLSKKAAFGSNKNAVKADLVTIAWMVSL